MQDTLMTIIGIFLAALLIFIFPLMEIAGKTDELSETVIELAASDFVNSVASQGKITEFLYSSLVQKIGATGNTYEVEIEAKILDDNPSRITTTASSSLIGEKKYYSVYTNTITDKLQEGKDYYLKTDDYIIVKVKNKNTTIGSQLRSFLYQLMGREAPIVATTASALVLEHEEKPTLQIGTGPAVLPPVPATPEPSATPTPEVEATPTPVPLADLKWQMDYYWLHDDDGTDPWTTDYSDKSIHAGENSPGKDADGNPKPKEWMDTGVWDGSVSRINIPKRPNGTTTDIVEMIGNCKQNGKGAAWATLEGADLKGITFEYDVEQGDSFETSGLLFNLKGTDSSSETLEGYYISLMYRPITRLSYSLEIQNEVNKGNMDEFNEKVRPTYDGGSYVDLNSKQDQNQYLISGAVWKIKYNKGHTIGKNARNQRVIQPKERTLLKTFDAGAVKYVADGENKIKFTGKISLQVAANGYVITINGKQLQKIDVDSSEFDPNSFGFLSEHYSHNCQRIGYNKYTNIVVETY